MQQQFDTYSLRSAHIYQIFAYVKNLDVDHTGNVSGMLLYAKTDETVFPHHDYLMSGNKISLNTLNLDCPFDEIKRKLDAIAYEYFH